MTSLPLADLIGDPITRRYLSGESLGLPTGIEDVIARYRARDVERAGLGEAIEPVMRASGIPERCWRSSLDQLARGRALAVVTGQQLGSLGGPLYALLKAYSAVELAARLTQAGMGPVVPVFWLASQDHDLAEVDHADVVDDDGNLRRLRFRAPSGGAPIGTLSVNESMREEFDGWHARVARKPHAALADVLAPRTGESWTDWFVRCLGCYLPGTPLLFFDPLRHAGPAGTLIDRALAESDQARARLRSGAARLDARGFKPPLEVDDGSLVFDHRAGRRVRLRVDGDRVWSGTQVAPLARVREAIRQQPSAFSGNVALRPVLQGALLPCIAYVGGPAEIAYYHELPELFEWLGVPCPVLVPRLSATFVPRSIAEVAGGLGIVIDRALREPRELAAALERFGTTGAIGAGEMQLRTMIEHFGALCVQDHPEMERPARRAHRTMERALERLARQAQLARLSGQDGATPRLEALLAWLLPRGKLQERVLCAAGLVVEYGATRLLEALGHKDPRGARHLVVEL